MPTDPHECSNCYHTGQLNQHGRCECCDSPQVMSLHKFRLAALGWEGFITDEPKDVVLL
jgi:hypothetical protein